MASTGNSPKVMQHTRSRPSVPRAIVPAIPLPYIQKRKQQVAAREKATEEAVKAQEVDLQSSPTLSPTTIEPEPAVANGSNGSNGSSVAHSIEEPEETANSPVQTPSVVPAPSGEDEVREPVNEEPAAVNEKGLGKWILILHISMG